MRLINDRHQLGDSQHFLYLGLHLRDLAGVAVPYAKRPRQLPELRSLCACAVEADKSCLAQMTVAPGPDTFGFPASLKPVDHDHGLALERSIKLLPDLAPDGRQAKLCPYPLFVAALVFHQGANNAPEVTQVGVDEFLVIKIGEFVPC